MPRVGFDKVYYAVMNDETAETYSVPAALPGGIGATISPVVNSETLHADDQAWETATAFGGAEVELNLADIPQAAQVAILGHTVDANGVLTGKGSDNAPYVALGFRSRKANGAYRYFWFYKGKFQPSEEEFATKEDTPTFQTPTITATFLPRQTDAKWKVQVDSDDTGTNISTVVGDWFTAVYDGTPIV